MTMTLRRSVRLVRRRWPKDIWPLPRVPTWGPQGAILPSTATNPLEVPTPNPGHPYPARAAGGIGPRSRLSPVVLGLRLETSNAAMHLCDAGNRPLGVHSHDVVRENAVTGTSFPSATGALSVFGGEGALASANEVPVTAFSLALRSTRRPLPNHPNEARAPMQAIGAWGV